LGESETPPPPIKTLQQGELLGEETVKSIRDYVYEGQIVDRVTEDEYATQNLMDVRL
jgi:hypothetical protein